MNPTLEIISLILNLVLGTGLIATLLTLSETKRKAAYDADLAKGNADEKEIENVDKAIKIWREIAESMGVRNQELINQNSELIRQRDELTDKIDKLDKQVTKLTAVNNKIVRLLDHITPENMVAKINEIKNQIG